MPKVSKVSICLKMPEKGGDDEHHRRQSQWKQFNHLQPSPEYSFSRVGLFQLLSSPDKPPLDQLVVHPGFSAGFPCSVPPTPADCVNSGPSIAWD